MKIETETIRTDHASGVSENSKGLEELEKEFNAVLAGIIKKAVNKPDSKTKMLPLAKALLSDWSGNNIFKKLISRIIEKKLAKPPKQKTKNLSTQSTIASDIGRLVTLRWMIQSEKSRQNPFAKNDKIISSLTDFLQNSDFGELRESIEASKEGSLDLSERINGLMEQFPGKMMAVAGSMPTVISKFLSSFLLMLKQQNMTPPDMLVSMMDSLSESVDGKLIGQVLNEKYELTRKRHIGSLLQGDGKTPALESLFINKLRQILPEIDHVIFGKMKIGVQENAEAKKNAFSKALTEFPDFAKELIKIFPRVINSKVRVGKRRVDILGSMHENELGETVAGGFSKLDTLEIAELVSAALHVLNSIHNSKPDLVLNTLSSIASSIDNVELESAAGGIIKDAVIAVKPAARAVMSSVLDGICEILTPEPGENSDALDESLSKFARILNSKAEV